MSISKFSRCILSALLVFFVSSFSRADVATGTGFFITENGYLVTNFHVISNFDTFQVRDHRGNIYPARFIQKDAANDLAILKVEGKFSALPIARSDSVRLAENVFTLGYPNTRMQGVSVKFTEGTISSLSGILDEPNSFQVSVPVQPGNSGGPLFNREGMVIGVVVAKLDALTSIRSGTGIPEAVNYAIKSNYLIELVRTDRNITEHLLGSNIRKRGLSIPELVTQLESSVGMVICSGSKINEAKGSKKSAPTQPDNSGRAENRGFGEFCELGSQCRTGLICNKKTDRCDN